MGSKQGFGVGYGESLGLAIKWDPAHDPTGAGVPWIVFKESEVPGGSQTGVNLLKCLGPVSGWDVVEDAITKDQINGIDLVEVTKR